MNNTTQTTYLSVWPAIILGSLRTFTLILDADVGCGEVFPVRVGRTNMARPKVCRLGPSIAASISGGQGSWLASEPYGDRRGPTPAESALRQPRWVFGPDGALYLYFRNISARTGPELSRFWFSLG